MTSVHVMLGSEPEPSTSLAAPVPDPTRRIVCTRCMSRRVVPSRTRTVLDGFLGWFGLLPYRCLACMRRFHHR